MIFDYCRGLAADAADLLLRTKRATEKATQQPSSSFQLSRRQPEMAALWVDIDGCLIRFRAAQMLRSEVSLEHHGRIKLIKSGNLKECEMEGDNRTY